MGSKKHQGTGVTEATGFVPWKWPGSTGASKDQEAGRCITYLITSTAWSDFAPFSPAVPAAMTWQHSFILAHDSLSGAG